jgi:hypothetical protein
MSTLAGATATARRPRHERLAAPVLLGAAVLGASVLLHVRDPHQSGSYGFCPWLVLTGTFCPGCGGLRAVNDLTHGDVGAALSSNLLLVGGIPLVVWLWGRWLVDRWRGVTRLPDQRRALAGALLFAAVALVFWVLRNLPALGWLAP